MTKTLILEVIFVNSLRIDDNLKSLDIYTTRNSCHGQHVSKMIQAFLPADEGTSWSLLPTLVSFLLGDIVQAENTYTCTLTGTG